MKKIIIDEDNQGFTDISGQKWKIINGYLGENGNLTQINVNNLANNQHVFIQEVKRKLEDIKEEQGYNDIIDMEEKDITTTTTTIEQIIHDLKALQTQIDALTLLVQQQPTPTATNTNIQYGSYKPSKAGLTAIFFQKPFTKKPTVVCSVMYKEKRYTSNNAFIVDIYPTYFTYNYSFNTDGWTSGEEFITLQWIAISD